MKTIVAAVALTLGLFAASYATAGSHCTTQCNPTTHVCNTNCW